MLRWTSETWLASRRSAGPWLVMLAGFTVIAAGSVCLYRSAVAPAGSWSQSTLDAFGVGLVVGGLVDVLAITGLERIIAAQEKRQEEERKRQEAEREERRQKNKALTEELLTDKLVNPPDGYSPEQAEIKVALAKWTMVPDDGPVDRARLEKQVNEIFYYGVRPPAVFFREHARAAAEMQDEADGRVSPETAGPGDGDAPQH